MGSPWASNSARVPTCAAWLRGSMPSMAAISRAAATASSGLTPVRTPMDSNIVTRSSVGRLPTDATLVGMAMPPPMPQIEPSMNFAPASTAASTLAVPQPDRLCTW